MSTACSYARSDHSECNCGTLERPNGEYHFKRGDNPGAAAIRIRAARKCAIQFGFVEFLL